MADVFNKWRGEHGDFAVPCVVSGRWLQFSDCGSTNMYAGEAISVDVMTESGDKQRKLCELIITREELLRVLSLIEKPAQKW